MIVRRIIYSWKLGFFEISKNVKKIVKMWDKQWRYTVW